MQGEEYKLLWKETVDFVRMASRLNTIIVPFGILGADDAYVNPLPFSQGPILLFMSKCVLYVKFLDIRVIPEVSQKLRVESSPHSFSCSSKCLRKPNWGFGHHLNAP